ncbi:DUF2950 family protein [Cupriavidus sp. 8B]
MAASRRGWSDIPICLCYWSAVRFKLLKHHGIVFEKNLGPKTGVIARQMTEYNPDASWKIVQQLMR